MDEKRQNQYPSSSQESSVSIIPVDINFGLNSELIFLKKKVENIGIALYLISDKIKDNPDIRDSLKNASSTLITSASIIIQHDSLSDTSKTRGAQVTGLSSCLKNVLSALSLSLSHIKIGYLTQAISPMNFSIVQQQLVDIMIHVDGLINSAGGDHLKAQLKQIDFFTHAKWPSQHHREPAVPVHKGHINIMSDMNLNKSFKADKAQSVAPSDLKDRKEKRKNAIIALLSTKSGLTVKDFLAVISDCSEKTIQRELIELVAGGVLKKEGERRWSRYSLPSSDKAVPKA